MTDADYKHTLGIVRSLGKAKIQVSVVAKSRKDLASSSRYCFSTFIVCGPAEPRYVDSLIDILRSNGQDLLIPVSYAATIAFASRKDELTKYARLEVAHQQQILSAANKRSSQQSALSLGIPVPDTLYPETFEDVRRQAHRLRYPVIVKPVHESSGVTVRCVQSCSDLLSMYETDLSQARLFEGNLPMIQEFIPGRGYGFFGLYQAGDCKRVFMHRRVREYPPSGGASCCAESFYDARLKEYGVRLLDHLKWHGVAMVEFRRDSRDHEFRLLEINPKFWGSLDLALAAGVNFPLALCEMAEGKQLEYSEVYRRGLRYHWPLSGEAQHFLARPRSCGSLLRDALNPRVESNIWLTDPRPNWREALTLLRSTRRRIAN